MLSKLRAQMGEPTRLKMPAKLAERARALAAAQASGDDSWVAPPVRDAATVIMVRDLPDGLHVYLQRRVRTMALPPACTCSRAALLNLTTFG